MINFRIKILRFELRIAAGQHIAAKYSNANHDKSKKLFLPLLIEHSRFPTLPSRALTVKLYYRNQENVGTTFREFRHLKKQRREPIAEIARRDKLAEVGLTGQLGCVLGRGRKSINNTDVEETIVERSSESLH